MTQAAELICPAGTPAALRAAVDAGADAVYVGFRDRTNARNFPGLNFSRPEMKDAVALAHRRGVKVFVAINTFALAGEPGPWRAAIDDAARLGADAAIVADIAVAAYAAEKHPDLRLHLSVQASASTAEAIEFFRREFGIRRVILPRTLTVAEVAALIRRVPVEAEVFLFGAMGVMAEGRCALSSYVTGISPNLGGACSPAEYVRYDQNADGALVSRLGRHAISSHPAGEPAGYPTLCRGCYHVRGRAAYPFEEPTSLNAVETLPALLKAGVRAFKIEGRQRGRAYVAEVVGTLRRALDAALAGKPLKTVDLRQVTEGHHETLGGYAKIWH
ncbi:MAG: U32 family peptidase [Alphaproteobacteria bacterium]|nr:U32 family peptidase [Alphaproteobacteria bacterium]MBM3951735.1 U32 family peptidase [Rhodospirillales bacterium]